ncbi:hypothetical protein B0H34DRAFT_647475 [Crassisporium funariophilum]|nr:hypothetical protein B0H34DRAFT_647475 [Crassisporium funariophilum]
MQVTIALLPVSLSLVHIPRSRLNHLSHPILRQILQPNPAFLNITCNEIELSIFAEDHMLQDFEPIARRDRQRQRSRSGSGSSRKGINRGPLHAQEPVEISYEKWSVLQIDSHSDQIGNSGTRVYDLSAPLATAGISILYQSSYMSDFIFVRESRLQEAMDLFESAGFQVYNSDATHSLAPSLSPIFDDRHSVDFAPKTSHNIGAVLTRSISGTDILASSISAGTSKVPGVTDETPFTGQQSPRNKSHSPTSGEVHMLRPDLACVGLSDELGVDHWGLKIVKLVAFPDLIPPSAHQTHSTKTHAGLDPFSVQPSHVDFPSMSMFLSRGRGGSDTSSSSSTSDDDGYFSHSPQNASTTSLNTSTSRSYSDLQNLTCNPNLHKSPSKHFLAHLAPLSSITTPKPHRPLHFPSNVTLPAVLDLPTVAAKTESRVPFFSFTRTPEGSSLTADVHLLATLFPPHERHMVICSGELDAADLRLEGIDSSDEEDEADDNLSRSSSSSLKCLQIDLRRFGLDKHGLVNRFSRVLEENNINHMYSSTFKTANLLVDKRDAIRAQSLLRAC